MIRLREGAEAGEKREGRSGAESRQVYVEFVEYGEEICRVQGWRDGVLQIIVIPTVCIAEIPYVALEGAVREYMI